MKKTLIILSFILVISASIILASCHDNSSYRFDFFYSVKNTSINRGEHIEIEVTLKNSSEKQYKYVGSESDFRASAELYCNETDYIIHCDPVPSTDDIGKHSVAPGESRMFVYGFMIPQDAPAGEYHLKLSFYKSSQTFNTIFTLDN